MYPNPQNLEPKAHNLLTLNAKPWTMDPRP